MRASCRVAASQLVSCLLPVGPRLLAACCCAVVAPQFLALPLWQMVLVVVVWLSLFDPVAALCGTQRMLGLEQRGMYSSRMVKGHCPPRRLVGVGQVLRVYLSACRAACLCCPALGWTFGSGLGCLGITSQWGALAHLQ